MKNLFVVAHAQSLHHVKNKVAYFDWGSGVDVGDTGILWQKAVLPFPSTPSIPQCDRTGETTFFILSIRGWG